MVYVMKLNNTVLFKYLCLDLNMKYVHNELDVAQLGGLKDSLLELVEQGFPDEKTDTWISEYYRSFEEERRITAVSLRTYPEVFARAYQVLSWALKIRKPHTKQQEEAYIKRFLDTESITKAWRVDRSNPVTRLAKWLVRRTFAHCDLSAERVAQYVRHGPGASFDGEVGADKNILCLPPRQLLDYASYDLFFYNMSAWADHVKGQCRFVRTEASLRRSKVSWEAIPFSFVDWTKAYNEYVASIRKGVGFVYAAEWDDSSGAQKRFIESRLTLVPKSYKGPRGVFISPKEAMNWQLAVGEALVRHAETTWLGLCYDPNDQKPSGSLAHEGSYDKWSGTLDLSDASDRVPLELVAHLFHRMDYLALARTRPCYVWLPNGERHRLGMFSPMGDGKTFPVLTIICAVLSVCSILDAEGFTAARPPTIREVESCARSIRVFGDDIIVPSQYFEAVVRGLEIHNLKVNVRKSFVHGFFREACGVDAYRGVNVTPLRQKEDLDSGERKFNERYAESCDNVLSLIAMHNATRRQGWIRTANALSGYIRQLTGNKVGLTTDVGKCPWCLYVPGLVKPDCSRCSNHSLLVNDEGGLETDMVRCVWCGTRGLISRLDLLRIPVKYDRKRQCVVQRVLAPTVVEYERSLEPWWDLNHALFPKEQRYSLFASRRKVVGSPEASRLLANACAEAGIKCNTIYGGGLRLQWVPVI